MTIKEKKELEMRAKAWEEGLKEICNQKDLSIETVQECLISAIKKAYIRFIGGDEETTRVNVELNDFNFKVDIIKKVVEEAKPEVDDLEISLVDAKKFDKKAKLGDDIVIPVDNNTIQSIVASTARVYFTNNISQAEKQQLFERYKNKRNEMITGYVIDCDERGCSVRLGHSSLFLSRKEMIGEEQFEKNDSIRLFISDVVSTEKGSTIKVSRADAGFVKKLFEEEVPDVYNGTVVIKSIARKAGFRSKVSVYTTNPNVDPVGACIGLNGNAIKRVRDQLGNFEKDKDHEKVDVFMYNPNPVIYIADALAITKVLKVCIIDDTEAKSNLPIAIVIVPNDSLLSVLGKRGSNVLLARKITGYALDIHEEKDLVNYSDYEFVDVEEERAKDIAKRKQDIYDNYKSQVISTHKGVSAGGYTKKAIQSITDEDIDNYPTNEVEEPVVAAKTIEATPKVEEKEAAVTPVSVKTTTTLESLEAQLEADKKKEQFKPTQKTSKRPRTITFDEVPETKVEENKPAEKKITQADIYTKEELEELDNAELEAYEDEDEDIDYDEYDKYYDDENK